MKNNSLLLSVLIVVMVGFSGCIAGNTKVSQEDLAKQWEKIAKEDLQKLFCNTTMSGFERVHWKVFWSSDCQTGKLEVGPYGEYKTEYRTVEILDDKYCVTAEGNKPKKCYTLYEKDGEYLDINASGKQSPVNIKVGIPEKMQKELDEHMPK